MKRYIIQQEVNGWFWRRESNRSWLDWFSYDLLGMTTSGGPFASAEAAEKDARNNQFRRFCATRDI
jgi:hypothetical protein